MSNQLIETDLRLFDMDGTIVNTIEASERAWQKLCSKCNVDPEELFKHSHGVRSQDIIASFFPLIDNTDNKASNALEKDMADNYLSIVKLVKGSDDLLLSLDRDPMEPSVNFRITNNRRWAIFTGGNPYIAHSWFRNVLKHVGEPQVFITATDVTEGKPSPEGYLISRDKLCKELNLHNPCRSVVFEDTTAGVKAGKAMNDTIVVAVTTTICADKLYDAGADWVVDDLSHISVTSNPSRGPIYLKIDDILPRN